MIRGFSSNRLLYAIDGIRMNNAIFRSGNLQNVISIDPFTIENTEIIFGPGSVAYGSDAIGGVMAFNTKSPSLNENKQFEGLIKQRYSSANNESTSHVDLSYGNTTFSGISSFTYNSYGDLRMGSNNPRPEYDDSISVTRINGIDSVIINNNPAVQKNTGFKQYHFMQKFRYRPNRKNDIQICITLFYYF